MNGLVLTRDMLLAAIGANPAKDVGLAVRTWRKAAIRAQKAGFVDGAGQEHPPSPDYQVRCKAADYLVKFHGAYPAEGTGADASRPVNVAIILTHATNGHAGAALQSHGVRLHLDGDNGHGA